MINFATVLKRSPDVRYRRLDEEGILIQQSLCEVIVLNETGIRILDLLEKELSVAMLVDIFIKEYAIDERNTLERDLLIYLEHLLEAEVIEIVLVDG